MLSALSVDLYSYQGGKNRNRDLCLVLNPGG